MTITPQTVPMAGQQLHGSRLTVQFRINRAATPSCERIKFVDRNWNILDALKTVAAELNRPAAQVALAWTLGRPGVASTLIGASKVAQLESNIAATSIRFTAAQAKHLDEASVPPVGFSSGLTQPAIRRMVFGGHDVAGWGEHRN